MPPFQVVGQNLTRQTHYPIVSKFSNGKVKVIFPSLKIKRQCKFVLHEVPQNNAKDTMDQRVRCFDS